MTLSFLWPENAAVLLDTAPPEVERIVATFTGVEVLFSEPVDSATLPAAVTVDGETLTWTAAGSEYRYRAQVTLPPGPHQVESPASAAKNPYGFRPAPARAIQQREPMDSRLAKVFDAKHPVRASRLSCLR